MSWLEDTDGGSGGQFISLKLGDVESFVVKTIQRTEENPDWHPKKKDKTSQGWHLLLTDTQGRILEVGSYSLQTALREAGMKDRDNPQGPLVGRRLTIKHEDRGSYQVILGPANAKAAEESEDVPF